MANTCKKQIISAFAMSGYSLRSDASKFLQSVFEEMDDGQRSMYLRNVVQFIESQALTSSLIERSLLEKAIDSLRNLEGHTDACLNVLDAFSTPLYTYHQESKKFLRKCPSANSLCLYGRPDSKSDMFIERYKVIRQRTTRHKLFTPPLSANNFAENPYSLKSVDHLLGASSRQTNLIVLGMITQLKEGQFHLEDPTGCIKLNLSSTTYKEGLFTENSMVLVEGYCEDDIFHVASIGFPPLESAAATFSHFPYFNLSTDTSSMTFRISEKLKTAEKKNPEAMFVFLSDVWLDQLKIMKKLEVLFAGYSQFPPTCFVLMGHFQSVTTAGNTKHFEEGFTKLGTLIGSFPSLVNKSTFVFVPGPEDPGLPYILPRPPIPQALLTGFLKRVPKAIFTTNPCRIQYCSQEILVFRQDIVSKMCRNAIHTPWEHDDNVDIPSLFVKSIIANSHLVPLPLNIAPIYWEFNHALWLYPLPDVVVCADKCDPYTVSNTGSIFFNPGSLPKTEFFFKVYNPASREVEDSQITDEHIN